MVLYIAAFPPKLLSRKFQIIGHFTERLGAHRAHEIALAAVSEVKGVWQPPGKEISRTGRRH